MPEENLELLFPKDDIYDEDEKDSQVPAVQYDISTYGADYPVDGLVKRLQRGDIFIPDFQRDYVWNQVEASRLIESLLLGLPIPGVFLAKESEGNKLLIIDGQQRLKSLQFFYNGYFNPKEEQKTKRVFKLIKVQKKFEGLTYDKLVDNDRRKLDDSIIHATIVKQESPDDDNTSIYHVFERLNNGGKKLAPQEIRTAIYYGRLNDEIQRLNDFKAWRELYGPVSARLKDRELILRFMASFYWFEKYSKPMAEFLNKFNRKFRNPQVEFIEESSKLFKRTITYLKDTVGKGAFRPEGILNVSVYEGVTVGLARVIINNGLPDAEKFKELHRQLLKDKDFIAVATKATSDETVFKERHDIVDTYFSEL